MYIKLIKIFEFTYISDFPVYVLNIVLTVVRNDPIFGNPERFRVILIRLHH